GVSHGTFVEPSKVTLLDYLRKWLVTPRDEPWRPATVRLYRNVIEKHIAKHPIAFRPIQGLRPSDVDGYLASLTGARASVDVQRAVLAAACRQAVDDLILVVNPA